MALRLLKRPDAVPSEAAAGAALVLAGAAWNSACGDPVMRQQHQEALRQLERDGASPWPELIGTDTDRLISGLIEYKQASYPGDRRRIIAIGMTSAGNVRVEWLEDEKR